METGKHKFSFEVDEGMADRVGEIVSFCRANNIKSSDGLLLRALLAWTEIGPDLLEAVGARKAAETAQRQSESGARPKQLLTFQVDKGTAQKTNAIVGYCRDHSIECSDGVVLRAIIDRTEQGPDLLGVIRARIDSEKAKRREKPGASAAKGHVQPKRKRTRRTR
jgi:hypothetical protein